MESTKMDNITFKEKEFYNWLQTTTYNGPVGVTGKFYLKEGGRSKFLEAMKKNVDFSKTEVGVRHYKLNADFKNPLIFWLVQEWDTVTDLRKHCTSEAYVQNGKMLQDILEEPMWQIGLYKSLD